MNDSAPVVHALDIGGTHVSAARVDPAADRILPPGRIREPLSAAGSAAEIVGAIVRCAARLAAPPRAQWSVAIPGPFDYERGIGRFEGVGKFEALRGVDLRAELAAALPDPAGIGFLNDADAFLLGEWRAGAARGRRRAVGITLGTGVGSAFAQDGVIVDSGPTVPPQGRVDLLTHAGRPLEETVSRRAIRAAYAERHGGGRLPDVRELAESARRDDRDAAAVIAAAFTALGSALGPWLAAFGAQILVVGGSMAASWDLIAEPLRNGIDAAGPTSASRLTLALAERPDDAPLLGAAFGCSVAARTEYPGTEPENDQKEG